MKIPIRILYSFLAMIIVFNSALASVTRNSIDDNFNIKAGISINKIYFKTGLIPTNLEREDHTESSGIGFNTSVGYKWNDWELMISSDVLFGTLKDITFTVDSNEVSGDGNFRFFTLSPLLRYYTPYTIGHRWNLFYSAGPTWSLHTFTLNNTSRGTNFSSGKRISFENRGGSINIGFEEIVPYKDTHPTYFEIGYSYMRSHQIFIVDASDFKDAKTLQKGNSEEFHGHYFILRFGITLF
ncbi:MAG: outer membrane beta-barrel protein [Bacteriovorax sp.]|nr:outer membrane beta-barrel protein [Bacteriovorax sp.]